ncbi:MAG: hypothetical protein ACTHK6_09290 [Solirubrobacterales bacterium]
MRRRAVKPRVPALSLALAAFALATSAGPAVATPQATLKAKFRPERLGAPTAVSLAFHLHAASGEALPALTDFALRLPRGMGFGASELGLATCSESSLLSSGVRGCPRESLMGTGSAQVRVPFSNQVVRERARVFIFMARPVAEQTTTLFYFDGRRPVIAPIVLQSQIVTPEGSSDSILDTPVQTIPTAPDGPEARMVALRSTIGPSTLRYFRRVNHRRVPYRPEGLSLPDRCPPGGFRFAASFRFQDGSRTDARAAIPCPTSHARHRGGGAERN